jgi:hypothetical protein
MDKALSVINELPSNKFEINRFVTTIKAEILAGNEDPLKILKQLKMCERTLDVLLTDKELEDFFLEGAAKYGKSFDYLDTHFDIREVGVKYDYSTSNDSVWIELDKAKSELDKKLKDRETFLKALPEEDIANSDTGEIIHKPLKTSTTKVVVKL